MMQILRYEYPAEEALSNRVHVGVVSSGDLEILLEPSPDRHSHVLVTTSVEGFESAWENVLERFFKRFRFAASIEINDFGATPGTVMLRLLQAAEEVGGR